jgi:HNH endonuclease
MSADLFWAKVNKSGPCWLWTGATNGRYGKLGRGGKQYTAHRFAYELARGPIPTGSFVLHSCDTPLCVRPDHLSLGTQRDNMGQAAARGRTARGEGHGRHKLTAEQVLDLRTKRTAGWNIQELADWFGISLAAVSLICRGLNWRDAGGPLVKKDPRWKDGTQ